MMHDILIVEDDEQIRRVLSRSLSNKGYTVTTARNGEEALADLEQAAGPPRVIIADLMMPVMDGWKFRERLLLEPRWADIPVIIPVGLRLPGVRRRVARRSIRLEAGQPEGAPRQRRRGDFLVPDAVAELTSRRDPRPDVARGLWTDGICAKTRPWRCDDELGGHGRTARDRREARGATRAGVRSRVGRPRAAYASRLEARRATARASSGGIGRSAPCAAGSPRAGSPLAFWVFKRHTLGARVLWLPLAGFVVVMVLHERLARRRARVGRATRLYERALSRLDGAWDAQPEDGARFLEPLHPFAADLDLFGAHSLFQLLCTARTAEGEATLAGWLTEPAAPAEIRARQAAVAELRPRLELREALWIAGHDVRATVDAKKASAWGNAAPRLRRSASLRLGLLGLSLLMAGLGSGWLTGHLPAAPAGVVAALVLAVTQIFNLRVSAIVEAVAQPDAHLALLAELVRIVEREFDESSPRLAAPRLLRIRERLQVEGRRASKEIARLGRLVRRLDWQRNLVFAPVGYALLWRPQLGYAVEAWRWRNGRTSPSGSPRSRSSRP